MRAIEFSHVQAFRSLLPVTGRVLEVGSRDVGTEPKHRLRYLFDVLRWSYLGIDKEFGPNVDLRLDAHNLLDHFPPDHFTCVLCCDVIEHDPEFWLTVYNCIQVLAPNGWLFLSGSGPGESYHPHPVDVYRFAEESIPCMLEGLTNVNTMYDRKMQRSVMGYGKKPDDFPKDFHLKVIYFNLQLSRQYIRYWPPREEGSEDCVESEIKPDINIATNAADRARLRSQHRLEKRMRRGRPL